MNQDGSVAVNMAIIQCTDTPLTYSTFNCFLVTLHSRLLLAQNDRRH